MAGQIRSRRICHSIAALQGLNEPCPEGLTLRVVQNAIRFVPQLELFRVYTYFSKCDLTARSPFIPAIIVMRGASKE
ncbi:hypothetical protein EF878_19345 [Dickeya undicola]|uniref:Uncharacterized protein n=1 Tax=Dickeya undicola TaxID=1577887 RepID=A0A3N0FRU4_9GAMM|nr:hypothetical protein EF878_19345 [Dickeya undicola]